MMNFYYNNNLDDFVVTNYQTITTGMSEQQYRVA